MPLDLPDSSLSRPSAHTLRPLDDNDAREFPTSWRQPFHPKGPKQHPFDASRQKTVHGSLSNGFAITLTGNSGTVYCDKPRIIRTASEAF